MTKKELEQENAILKQAICDIRMYICDNLTNVYTVNGERFDLIANEDETARLMEIMGVEHYGFRDWYTDYFNIDIFKRNYGVNTIEEDKSIEEFIEWLRNNRNF